MKIPSMKDITLIVAAAAVFAGLGACASKKKQPAYQPYQPAPEVIIQK